MSVASIFRFTGTALEPLEYCDMTETSITAADSWLVSSGMALALDTHRDRFAASAGQPIDAFWDAAIASIPRGGDWFPRVESHDNGRLVFRLRLAPDRTRSVVLASWGDDPRTRPRVKGPDLERMLGIRTAVQSLGAGEAAILTR